MHKTSIAHPKVPPPVAVHPDGDHGKHLHPDLDPPHLLGKVHHNRNSEDRTTVGAQRVGEFWGGGDKILK